MQLTTRLGLGDCLDMMKNIADHSIDLVLTDPPYGTTKLSWDTVIDLDQMWMQLKRITKPGSAIVLFAAQPFTSILVTSNIKMYKTLWVWNKSQSGSFANAKYHPLKVTEDIVVFCEGSTNYYPQMTKGKMRTKGGGDKNQQTGLGGIKKQSDEYYPINILNYVSTRTNRVHPTQKPVGLCEYLIRTYSNKGETVLDFTMGSGTTGVAAMNTGRNFIGIEKDPTYFAVAKGRVMTAKDLANNRLENSC